MEVGYNEEWDMSGMGGPDDEALHAMVLVDNYVELVRSQIPQGPSALECQECGYEIPEARRLAQPGCQYCVECQVAHDKLPRVKILTHLL
jgi:phage/conjugal plasmid C-4 type zinc finger TraR family protein